MMMILMMMTMMMVAMMMIVMTMMVMMITRLNTPMMMVPVLRSHPQQHLLTVGILEKIWIQESGFWKLNSIKCNYL